MGKRNKLKESSKNNDDLPTILKLILNILEVNPTLKYVIKKTKRDKRLVSRDIKRLIDRGYVKRLDRGLYKVIKTDKVVASSHQEYFRLHNLEIELLVSGDQHKIIKSTIFKNNQYFNVRGFGNVGNYFDLDVHGLITKENLFIFFPEDWELISNSVKELWLNLYKLIGEISKKWEQKFKLLLFKDGKINFNIRNIHIAYIKGDVVKEFKKSNISYLCVKDQEDGKGRFLIDMSKGFPEIEFIHPEKAIIDVKEAEFFGQTLIDQTYRKLMSDVQNYDHIPLSQLSQYMVDTSKQVNDLAHGLKAVIDYLKSGIPKKSDQEVNKDPPDYFG